jgi:hypothetical protein
LAYVVIPDTSPLLVISELFPPAYISVRS